jgi:hypothetical protein
MEFHGVATCPLCYKSELLGGYRAEASEDLMAYRI